MAESRKTPEKQDYQPAAPPPSPTAHIAAGSAARTTMANVEASAGGTPPTTGGRTWVVFGALGALVMVIAIAALV